MDLDEVMKFLYFKKETYFIDIFGKIKHNITTLYADRNNCKSLEHIEQWLSLNDLLNTSRFLNKEWKPDWNNNNQEKYVIELTSDDNLNIKKTDIPCHFVYFKSEEIAENAINILGENKIKIILRG